MGIELEPFPTALKDVYLVDGEPHYVWYCPNCDGYGCVVIRGHFNSVEHLALRDHTCNMWATYPPRIPDREVFTCAYGSRCSQLFICARKERKENLCPIFRGGMLWEACNRE